MSLLVKNTFFYLIGNILGRLGAFLLLPLYTTHLSPEKFGILELVARASALPSARIWMNIPGEWNMVPETSSELRV